MLALSDDELQPSLSWDDIHLGISPLGSTLSDAPNTPSLLPLPLPTSSRGTSPELSHNTVLHVTPVMGAAASPSEPLTSAPASDRLSREGAAASAPQAIGEAAGSKESSGVSNGFLERLDVLSEEIKLHQGMGHRKIDVIIYKGFEHRCDRRADREKYSQVWRCRYAAKFGCKGKFRLEVVDLDNIEVDSVVTNYVDHNHLPFSIDSYGLTNVSTLPDNDQSSFGANGTSEQSHVISRLNEDEFSMDFDPEGFGSRIQSSPIRTALVDIQVINCTPSVDDSDEAAPHPAPEPTPMLAPQLVPASVPEATPGAPAARDQPDPDLTTHLVDTSNFDARGYRVQAFREVRRDSVGQDESQPPTNPLQ